MDYVIGLGANLGVPADSFARALDALEAASVRVLAVSPVYDSESLVPGQPDFENAAARVRCELAPPALLSLLLAIEASLGRVRRERWGPRAIDLDILWAQTPWASAELQIPHPELRARWFALKPLLDVAPELAAAYSETVAGFGPLPRGRTLSR